MNLTMGVIGLLLALIALLSYLALRHREPQGNTQSVDHERCDAEIKRLRAARDQAHELLGRRNGELGRLESAVQSLEQQNIELREKAALHDQERQSNASLSARLTALSTTLEEREEHILKLTSSEERLRKEVQHLTAENASLKTDQGNMNNRLEEQRQWVEEQTQAFENRISLLTSELLKKQSEEAQKHSKKTLDDVLSPFRTSLGDFKQQVEAFARDQLKEREGLASQIRTLAQVHNNLASQTDALTKALTNQNKQAGDWGEIQLTRYLESAGFEEGVHYKKQVSIECANEKSSTQRPDVILYLPEDRQVIIDAKVSIKAWTEANQSDNETERKITLKRHAESIRRHVRDLSGKDYASSPDISTLDFVVMFVPIEAAYIAAAAEDPHLFQEAFQQGVIVASPSLLLAILKLVNSLWNMHKQEENAVQVIELAGKIHNKLASFTKNFEDIGARLDSAKKAYEVGYTQLVGGRGSALKMLCDMEKHGIKVKKALPSKMTRAGITATYTDQDSLEDEVESEA